MITALSPRLLEASNGVLLAVLLMMFCGLASYLYMEWRELGFAGVYRDRKAAIALSVFVIGLGIRTYVVWWLRHAANHGLPAPLWVDLSPAFLVGGTVVAVIGGLCWLRVTTWRELPHWFWMASAVVALAFGLSMSL